MDLRNGIHIGRIRGIAIRVHWSWIFIFTLVTWSLATGFFGQQFPDWDVEERWLAAAFTAVLFFLSVLLHELSHAFVALAYQMRVPSITLFIFGGVSSIEGEMETPGQEFRVAIAGPAMSVALGMLFMVLALAMPYANLAQVLSYLGFVNFILAVFNLLPGTTAPVASVTLPAPWSLEAEAVEHALGVGPGGLDDAEVDRRRARCGINEVASRERVSAVAVLLRQFRSPLIYILFAALALTVVLQELVLVVNATVGFLQEYRAERAMEALQRLTLPRTTAVRGGHEVTIAARELVPGDIVVLEAGARVPADVRVTYAAAVEANESLLTGESVLVSKSMSAVPVGAAVADRASMLLAGTTVSRGRARGVVTATGPATELGRLAAALHRAEAPATPLRLRVARLARQIAISVAGVAVVGVSAGLLHGQAVTDLLLTMAALAVSAVPEGLPIVLTVTLAVGVRRMAAQRAVVRRLPAAETLGSCTVIGTDKTGTLTQNQMTVVEIEAGGARYDVTGGGYASGQIRLDGTAVDLDRHPFLHAVVLGWQPVAGVGQLDDRAGRHSSRQRVLRWQDLRIRMRRRHARLVPTRRVASSALSPSGPRARC